MLNNRTIILVEDTETDRILFQKYFSSLGYNSLCLDSGTKLISQMHSFESSVILLDIEMPGMNGFETIKIVRETEQFTNQKHVVIALTAHTDDKMMQKIAEAGFDDCLNKPVTKHVFEQKLQQYVILQNPVCSPEWDINVNESAGTRLYNLKMFDGEDPNFVRSIIELFILKTPQAIAELKSAFLSNDSENLRQIAHRLKPHFTFFGNSQLHQVLQCIEDIASGKPSEEKLPELIEYIELNGLQIIAQMKNDLITVDGD